MQSVHAGLGEVRVGPNTARSVQLGMQTRPWGSWRDPEAPPSYCLFLLCFILISLGFTVLTPSSP